MPLFDWQFSKIVTDFSSTCDGTLPSHWTTRFGEDLDTRNSPSVLENLNTVIRRSWSDETLDRMSLGLYSSRLVVFFGVIVSISHMWWFLLQDKHNWISHVVMAVFLTVLAAFIFVLLTQVVRLGGPAVGQPPYYYKIWDCHGMVTFSARLSKIHYETLLVFFAAITAEVGALGVMVYQIKNAIIERKKSPS